MRYISSQVGNKIRVVALSTSLANAKDLGEWIGATAHGLFNFPPGVRPMPLEIHIQGVDISNFEARMQAMTKPTYTTIVQHARMGKPAIVYVPTRKHTRLTAVDLMTYSDMDSEDTSVFLLQSGSELEPFVERINEPMLKETQIWCWLFTRRLIRHKSGYSEDIMMGHASRPLIDSSGKCVILFHAPLKEYYKKFLDEAFPVESHLQHYLHDNFNAEVVAGVIQTKQDAGVSHMHLSDHLSELVENTLGDLESSKCVTVEDDFLTFLKRSGKYRSILLCFSSSLTCKMKLKGLLEILASASEYEQLPIRPSEEELI
ncbi:hypothetical protein RND71_040285 [Anisodus tanguticus]|uniref:Uncharacterized protein n=1 Tax=Anisodus tanguticus TaxID=243964 RepID=A0AAE1QTR5_9SOLA|nr:hypothetical protein RND71_040285 [Anisodus tanguticus]